MTGTRISNVWGKILIFFVVITISANCALADCPSMDVTGDCKVDFEDFAVMAKQWLDEGVMPCSDLRRVHIAAAEAEMSTANIDASDGNEFMPGTYFIYKTDEGRFGKFMVENYEPSENHRLTIRWVTYDTDGMAYSYGTGLVIRGTYSCDLDEGLETDRGPDWMWDMQSSRTRNLAPYREAWFKMMRRAIAQPDGMVWVYIDEPVNIVSFWFEGYMSKYETTNAQYCQYLNSALDDGLITVYSDVVYAFDDSSHSEPYLHTYAKNDHSQITYSGGTFSVRTRDSYDMSNHPVVMVSWYGATAFCNYYGFKLPTEWQWQVVADYDGTYTYGCGMTISFEKANYYDHVDDVHANPLGLSSSPYTAPVDHYPSFGYGMNDMAGNVKEWTSSYFYMGNMDPYYRVLRGGSFGVADFLCTVSLRNYTSPGLINPDFGFRAVLNLE